MSGPWSLQRRIALRVGLALVLAVLVLVVLLRAMSRRFELAAEHRVLDLGVRALAQTLAQTPRAEREAKLQAMAEGQSLPLALENAVHPGLLGPFPPPLGLPPPPHPPPFARPGLLPELAEGFFPLPPEPGSPVTQGLRFGYELPDGQRLIVGPLPPMADEPWLLLALGVGFLGLVLVLATGLVAWPLQRRMVAIERAVEALAQGDFSARVEGSHDHELGTVAQALERSAVRLQRLFAAREELLQAVSHELGTPLSRMRFQLELLREKLGDGELRERAEALGGEIDELDELSTELVSWVEAERVQLRRVPVVLRGLLEELVELETAALEAPVPVVLGAVPQDWTLAVEQRQFARAIENLLRNALHHARTRIEVTVQREGQGVWISVDDDGPGIPPEDRQRVLEPLVRLERGSKRAHGGAGLGLAITRRIVEAHGGTLSVEAAELGGARMRSYWPGLELPALSASET